MKRLALILASLLVVAAAHSQEDSVIELSRDVLRFGIDSEVMDLLGRLEDQGEDRLDQDILLRFEESRNRTLQGRILEHFENRDIPDAGPAVSAVLLETEFLDATFLRTAVRYLSSVAQLRSPELLARYDEIARDDDLVAASVAIRAIGTDGTEDAVALLMELYGDFRDTDLKGAVVRALGDAGAPSAVEMLTRIVTDPYEDSSLRQYGVESLGKIAAPESLDAILSVLEDDNSLLRAYATAALGGFDAAEANTALTEGLRDSFWRVRVAALQGIASQGSTDALDAIGYKAQRDPEAPVRLEAIRTLGALAHREAFDLLREIASKPRSPQADRILAIQLLAENDLAASMDVMTGIIDAEWTTENSRLLDTVAQALVRTETVRGVAAGAEREALSETYEHLLSHPNFIIQVYAIRGIGRGGFNQFGDRLIAIVQAHDTGLLRSSALSALEALGIPLPEDSDETEAGEPADGEAENLEAGTTVPSEGTAPVEEPSGADPGP